MINKIDLVCRFLPNKYRILFDKTLKVFEQDAMNEFPEQGILISQLRKKLDANIDDIKVILHYLIYLGIVEGQDPILIEDNPINQYTFIGY